MKRSPHRSLPRLEALVFVMALAATACERRHGPSSGPPASPAAAERPAGVERRAETSGERPGSGDASASSGALVGRVLYRGALPGTTTMYVAEAGTIEAHTIIVDAATRGLKNAVVWVENCPPRILASSLPVATLDQYRWTFEPHVMAVRAGQTVRFLNSDIANHNVHSFTPGYTFNLGFPIGTEVTYRFRKPTGAHPVRLNCDVHEWMRGWVYVFPHDAFAITDREGRFRIEGVPPGPRRVRVHHADGDLETTREIVVAGGTETPLEIELGDSSAAAVTSEAANGEAGSGSKTSVRHEGHEDHEQEE